MTTTTNVPSCLPAGFAFLADATRLPAERLVDATGAAMVGFHVGCAVISTGLCNEHHYLDPLDVVRASASCSSSAVQVYGDVIDQGEVAFIDNDSRTDWAECGRTLYIAMIHCLNRVLDSLSACMCSTPKSRHRAHHKCL